MGQVEERNKAVLTRFWTEVWDQGKLDVVDEIFSHDFIDHGLAPGLSKQGPEGAKEAVTQFRTAMPDLYLRCDMMIAEGDKVLSMWESGGTQTGPLSSGRGTIPPTNNRGIVRGMTLNQLTEDGKIVAAWDNFDLLGMLMQLGVIPAPPPGAGGPPGGS